LLNYWIEPLLGKNGFYFSTGYGYCKKSEGSKTSFTCALCFFLKAEKFASLGGGGLTANLWKSPPPSSA